jgi:hypothetical protein
MPEGNHIHYVYEYTLFKFWLFLRASYSKTLGGHKHYVFKDSNLNVSSRYPTKNQSGYGKLNAYV